MNSRKRLFAVLALISGAVTLASSSVIVAKMFIPGMTVRLRFFFSCIFCAFVFAVLTVLFVCEAIKNENAKKVIVRTTVIVSFVAYLSLFLGLLFLIKAFSNHQAFAFSYNKDWLRDSLPNLIPLKHTATAIYNTLAGNKRFLNGLVEILGSIVLYMPFAFFLPAMFKNMRRFDTFLPTIVFITIAVEIFQGMFGLGSCRIDDFILGAGGACLAFFILRRPRVIKFFTSKHVYF